MRTYTKLILSSAVLSSPLMAITLPTVGDILKQTQIAQPQEKKKVLPKFSKEYKEPLKALDTVTIKVLSFKLQGNNIIDTATLQKLISSYKGKELGLNGLKEVASIITKYYRDKGYFVAKAYIPQQKIENGSVEIDIIEGVYGEMHIKNTSLVNTENLYNYIKKLKEEKAISVDSLERQMLLINDLSGVIISNVNISPGQNVGESDFDISASSTPKYSGYSVIDNYGSIYTGEYKLSVSGNVNSVTGAGDTLNISAITSNTANLKNAAFLYSRPLGYSGLIGSLNASSTRYNIDKITNFKAYGTTNIFGFGLSYPYVKTQSHTQTISFEYTHKNFTDTTGIFTNTQEAKKSMDTVTLALLNKYQNFNTSLSINAGKLSLNNAVAKTNDSTIKTQGNYAKVNFSLDYTKGLSPLVYFKTNLKAQKSFNKNLDSSEDISVGGSNGVRAYEDSELSGDQGYALSVDLTYVLPSFSQVSHNTSLFIDTAKVWRNSNTFNTTDNTRILNAFGIGYTLNYKKVNLKTTFAHGFGVDNTPVSEAEFSTSQNKFLAQAIIFF